MASTPNIVDLDAARAAAEAAKAKDSVSTNLKSGGGGGNFDGMEERIQKLEKSFEKIDAKLDVIGRDVAELKGKVSNLPATWQLIAINAGLIALVIGGAGGLIGLIRYLFPTP